MREERFFWGARVCSIARFPAVFRVKCIFNPEIKG
jgi:hypothetical protein